MLCWPQSSAAIPAAALEAWDTCSQNFTSLFHALMELDGWASPSQLEGRDNLGTALPLPLELMVKPLRKRFRYHFMEDRKTNNIQKVLHK